jgi:hypothetical protein
MLEIKTETRHAAMRRPKTILSSVLAFTIGTAIGSILAVTLWLITT